MGINLNPLGNSKKLSIVIGIFVALFLAFFIFGGKAKAAEMEFSAGLTAVRGSTTAVGLKVIQPHVIGEVGGLACGLMLIGQSTWGPHPENANTLQKTQAVAHCQVLATVDRFTLGIGGAYLQHEDFYNSGKINFSLEAQYRLYKDFYVSWQHFSNSGTKDPNYGRDIVLGSWRFK